MTDIQVRYWDLQETKRHNVAYETETFRHNKATEVQASKELTEVTRHNKATETETKRHNIATEVETYRSNRYREIETNRHNRATEKLDASKLAETKRHNIEMEGIGVIQANASWISAQAARTNAEANKKNAETNRRRQDVDASYTKAQTAVAVQNLTKAISEAKIAATKAKREDLAYEIEKYQNDIQKDPNWAINALAAGGNRDLYHLRSIFNALGLSGGAITNLAKLIK
jgi:hypothetical protein